MKNKIKTEKIKKRFKQGAILAESVVAIAIILIMTGAFVTLAIYVNKSFEKSTKVSLMIHQVISVQNIFISTSFVENNMFTLSGFSSAIQFTYGEIEKNIQTENASYKICFNKNAEHTENGSVVMNVNLALDNEKVWLQVAVIENGKDLFESVSLYKEVA